MAKTDNVLDWEEDEILTFSYGYLHPPTMRYMGFGIHLFGIYAAFQTIWLVPFMALAGGWMAFRQSGVQIQVKNRLRREYTSFLFKRGKWKSYVDYPDFAVLRGREGYKAYSRAMVELSDSEVVYDLYLLSKDHRKRLIVTRVKDRSKAEEIGADLAKKLGVSWTVYSPVISEKTRRRRR